MAKKVQQEDILKMVEAYQRIGTYAGVAREVGFSASTVRKYVVEYLAAQEVFEVVDRDNIFVIENIKSIEEVEKNCDFMLNWGDLCVLTNNEKEEVEQLWRELKK